MQILSEPIKIKHTRLDKIILLTNTKFQLEETCSFTNQRQNLFCWIANEGDKSKIATPCKMYTMMPSKKNDLFNSNFDTSRSHKLHIFLG
jgi:hypothetical protein